MSIAKNTGKHPFSIDYHMLTQKYKHAILTELRECIVVCERDLSAKTTV